MSRQPQTPKQIDDIVAHKVRHTVNQKVLKDMQQAIADIHKDDAINKRYAFIGMLILVAVILMLIYLFF